MIGAIAGDIIGSLYQYHPIKTTDFELFSPGSTYTDDTVLTVAVADAFLQEQLYTDRHQHYIDRLHDWFCQFPDEDYSERFYTWAEMRERDPYDSPGNGAATRVSAIAYACPTLERVLEESMLSAEITHSHPDAVRGAQATAAAVYMARQGDSKASIRSYCEETFGYDLGRRIDDIRPGYVYDDTALGSVPEALTAFLESHDYESAVRLAVSLGGDSDTLACIAGSVAGAHYGVPDVIGRAALSYLDRELLQTTRAFCAAFDIAIPD